MCLIDFWICWKKTTNSKGDVLVGPHNPAFTNPPTTCIFAPWQTHNQQKKQYEVAKGKPSTICSGKDELPLPKKT
jgi:hypothetical protein